MKFKVIFGRQLKNSETKEVYSEDQDSNFFVLPYYFVHPCLKWKWLDGSSEIHIVGIRLISDSRMPAAGQHTIFTDIGGQEVGTDLYLVVSVYRLGKIVNQQVIMDIAIVI